MINYSNNSLLSQSEKADIRDYISYERKIYNKGEIIMQSEKKEDNIAILESGIACLIRIEADGHRNIIDYYEPGDMFGMVFCHMFNNDVMYIAARNTCIVSLADYKKLSASGETYSRFVTDMVTEKLRKAQMHINILSKRSIRAKILTYFEYMRYIKGSDKFSLPLTLSDLADYISADRSAMSREINKLNKEGIIKSSGNIITLKKNEYGE